MLNRLPRFVFVLILLFSVLFMSAQTRPGKYSSVPQFLRLEKTEKVSVDEFASWLGRYYSLPAGNGFKLLSKEHDQLGMVHYRYQQTVNNIPVEGTMYIVHTKNGLIQSVNGDLLDHLSAPSTPVITREMALGSALFFTAAAEYKWQSAEVEKSLKENSGNANATYKPQPELVYVAENNKPGSNRFYLAYKMDVYAVKPLSRNYVYVDAVTGQVIYTKNRIENADVPATAHTQYNGVQTITTDSYVGGYRLREASRGNGIRTFNAANSTNPINTDFSNATTVWNNVNVNKDEYATDAHFASEMTYDFYRNNFSRNSLDNNGYVLTAYVHFDQDLDNAFWDGDAMNYGDGDSAMGRTPYTTLEIGGHEITHGLTEHTANLNYQDESGALNESFSDCMGTAIRQYVKQWPEAQIDYLVGDDNGNAFRSMRSPKSYFQPDTYHGQYWYDGNADHGGVHTNSGVQNHWFYVAAHGESGVNDVPASYNVPGIGIDKMQSVAYRALTLYLTPSANYSDCRFYTILATQDLFGSCSPEVETVTNAWYAVGVGPAFVHAVTTDFKAPVTGSCSVPFSVHFTDASSNAVYYVWNFGDGATSNQANPTHTYTTYGDFAVKLMSWSPDCGADSIVKAQLIHMEDNRPFTTDADACIGSNAALSASGTGIINWYDAPDGGMLLYTGNAFNTPAVNQNAIYYAENIIPGTEGTAGPADHSIGTGNYIPYEHYTLFNSLTPQTLISVVVDANSSGNRLIELRTSNDSVLATATVNLKTGYQTVPLNFSIPAINGLRLGIWSGTVGLYRNNAGGTYPYYSSDSSLILITNDVGDTGRYYFFYNWRLVQDPCVSERVPVHVNMLTAGCPSGIEETDALENISLLPNPAGNLLHVQVNAPNANNEDKLSIKNMLGETLLDKTIRMNAGGNAWSLDVSAFASGVYLLSLQSGKTTVTRRFVKE